MKYVGIVECISSAQLYITDITSRGWKPLIIYPDVKLDEYTGHYREIIRKNIGDVAEYIDEGPDYGKFLEEMKKRDIIAIIPGSDLGVPLADRLGKDLGLPHNDPDTTRLRLTKDGMMEALGKAGIRKIEGSVVTCDDDIRNFVKKHDLNRFVLKFSAGAGTVGLKICTDVESGIEHYHNMLKMENDVGFSMDTVILIQEFIGGTEYIVNTASFNGKHILTDIWFYKKDELPDGRLVYDTCELVKDLLPGHTELIDYAFKVLDAVDLRYGTCHSEFKVDEKGPVLIETNPRPMGAGQTAPFLDECLGHHITNISLSSYLEPELFDKLKRIPYTPRKYAMMKFISVPEEMDGDFKPAILMAERLDSYRELLFFGEHGMHHYPRTVDVDTCPMYVKLINEDYGRLMKDYNVIRGIERNFFKLLMYTEPDVEAAEKRTDLAAMKKYIDPMRKVCISTDDGDLVYKFGTSREVVKGEIFDVVVFARCGAGKLSDRYLSIISLMHQVRRGGAFVFVPESFEKLPYGRAAAESMLNLMGFRILVSTSEVTGFISGERM